MQPERDKDFIEKLLQGYKMRTLKIGTSILVGVFLSGCATVSQQQPTTPTDIFIENTMKQYGVGPNGRINNPDAVVVDPNPVVDEEELIS